MLQLPVEALTKAKIMHILNYYVQSIHIIAGSFMLRKILKSELNIHKL